MVVFYVYTRVQSISNHTRLLHLLVCDICQVPPPCPLSPYPFRLIPLFVPSIYSCPIFYDVNFCGIIHVKSQDQSVKVLKLHYFESFRISFLFRGAANKQSSITSDLSLMRLMLDAFNYFS